RSTLFPSPPHSRPPPQPAPGWARASEALAHLSDETTPAVTRSIETLIATAHAVGRPVGLCGQRPSDDPAFT
ncbi:hypothetical protein C7C46_33695, partial [Streptomyces tateyamensis]